MSKVSMNVISTYRSSWSKPSFIMAGVQSRKAESGAITPLNLNSVGAPHTTPAICPIHPAIIRSLYSATEIVRADNSAAANIANVNAAARFSIMPMPRSIA